MQKVNIEFSFFFLIETYYRNVVSTMELDLKLMSLEWVEALVLTTYLYFSKVRSNDLWGG